MAMFALCGTKSWAVTKRMTQRGVEEIDIGLLIGPRCSLKSSSSPQEMSRWNRLLSASNNNPTTTNDPSQPTPSQVCMCHKMNSTSVDRSHPNSHWFIIKSDQVNERLTPSQQIQSTLKPNKWIAKIIREWDYLRRGQFVCSLTRSSFLAQTHLAILSSS